MHRYWEARVAASTLEAALKESPLDPRKVDPSTISNALTSAYSREDIITKRWDKYERKLSEVVHSEVSKVRNKSCMFSYIERSLGYGSIQIILEQRELIHWCIADSEHRGSATIT